MADGSLTETLRETLSVFDTSGAPSTTTEVADRLDLGRQRTYKRLERLAANDELETKDVGASGRVWWRPQSSSNSTWGDGPEHNLELFRTLLDHSADGVTVIDPDTGRYLDANETACRRRGYPRAELLSLTVLDIDTEIDDLTEWRAIVDELRTSETITLDGRHRRPDGTTYPVEINATLVELDREYVLATARDVTERRERERELERTERRFEAVFEDPNILVGLLEPDGTVVDINGTAMEYVDVDLADVTGEPFWETPWWGVDEEIRADVREWTERAAAGEYVEFEADLVQVDGERYTIAGVFRPVTNDDGDVVSIVVSDRDVTERVERERELAASEQRYRTLAEHFPNGAVALFDDELKYTLLSGQGFEDVSVDPDEAEGRHVEEVWDDSIANELEPIYCDALAGEERTVDMSYDGREWMVHAVPVTDEAGAVLAGMAITQDITERKEYERYLQDAKAQLEAATDAGAIGTWEWDVQTDELRVGPSFARTFGIDAAAAREGVPLDQFIDAIHEDDRERVISAIETAVDECSEYEVEYRVWNADDECRWVVARGRVECDGDGDPSTFPGALTDITERKRAELELQRNRERLETLIEILPVGVVVADEDGSLIRANDAARDIWGGDVFTADSVAEYDKYTAVWAETGEPVGPAEWTMARVLDGAEVTEPDVYEISAFDGEERIVMNQGMPFRDEQGEVSGAVITMADITERREYQRKVEASNERLEQFAYAASHDLQEPLRMISSYLQLVESRYADDLDDDAQEFIEFAVDGAERMRDMIEALLQYARVDTRGASFEPVDLDDVIEEVREDLAMKIEERDATIDVDGLPTVYGDRSQLRQVFQNLLDNAIEYSGDEPPAVSIDAERDGTAWILSVRDDGVGIDPAYADRIFQVFNRLHTSDEHPGTGIGLALCERIVERHGGEIWVDSEPGEGATFSFTLQAADA